MLKKNKRIVVIGTGPGGAGVASLLQARGYQVTLLERNPFFGGKCWSFERDGFIVDSGVHMFAQTDQGYHAEIDRRVGGDLSWLVKDPGEEVLFYGRQHLKVYQSVIDRRSLWERLRLNHATKTLKKSGKYRMYALENELYRASKKYSFWEIIRLAVRIVRGDPSLFQELDDIPVQEFFYRITGDPTAMMSLHTFCMLLTVTPYHLASAGEFLWCASGLYRAQRCGVPRGGSCEIPGSFIRAFLRNGGRLRLGAEVQTIAVRDGAVRGVHTTAGEFIEADIVISNAGIKRTVEMAGAQHFPAGYAAYVDGLRYSYAFVSRKYGLSTRVIKDVAPGFFNIPHMRPDTVFDYIEKREIPEDLYLFVPMPTEWDPHQAPLGKQLVVMGVPGPSEVTPENVAFCERLLEKAEERLFTIFPQMRDHVQWQAQTHIAHTAAITGKPTGECIGLMQCVGQTGVNKPSPRTPVDGLWLVGTDAGARGVGTEQASSSALYVAGLVEYHAGKNIRYEECRADTGPSSAMESTQAMQGILNSV